MGTCDVLICRVCEIEPELVDQEALQDNMHCPSCGTVGNLGVATAAAFEYQVSKGLNDSLGVPTEFGSDFVSISYEVDASHDLAPPDFIFGRPIRN